MAKKATIKFTADTKEAESGLDKVSAKINQFSKDNKESLGGLSRLNGAITNAAKSFGAIGVAAGAAVAAVKKVNAVIKETTDLYKVQATAEKQLEVAAKNNPYLNDISVIQLKNFAGELQSISTIGDEQLLPLMAQLASAGRTQTEIQDIMSAALDVSASGAMSLESAVKNLNKTFSGLSGELGESIPQIKNLTTEQLKNGDAVKVIAQQYKGMAEETALATGSSEQLANAIGDYKELLGETFEGAFAPMRKWFTEVITNHTNAKKAAREHKKAVKEVYDENGEIKDDASESSLFTVWQNLKKETDEARQALIDYKKEQGFDSTNVELWDTYTQEESAKVQRLQKEANKAESAYRKVVKQRVDAEEAARKEAEAQAEIAAQVAEENSRLERREKLRKEYTDSLEDVQKQIAARRALGDEISEEEENQLLLNAATAAYIKMYSDPAFDRSQTKSGMWAGEQEQRDYIATLASRAKMTQEVASLKADAEKIAKEATSYLGGDGASLSEQIGAEIDALNTYMATLDQTGEAYAQLTEKKNQLAALQTEVQKKELEEQAENAKAKVIEITDIVADYIDRFADITNGITALVRQNNEEEADEALTNLSKQYTDGIISYEEYCEKKKALDKKAAQEEYKLKMWEWTASLLQATANIAQGVAKALAEGGPYAGPILAALIGASGAIQIATITANKPKNPSFATGGIVPGTSYSGDRVTANVNSGEMILNAQQQRNLWDMANSRGSGAVVNMPVTIENKASDAVNASAQLSTDGLTILINKVVNSQMALGKYNQSMDIAQSRRNGVEYQ